MVYLGLCSEPFETISYLVRVWISRVLDGFRVLFLSELSPTVILSNDLLIMIFLSPVGRKRPLTLWASGTDPFYHFGWFISQWPQWAVRWGGEVALWRSQHSQTVQSCTVSPPLPVLCPGNQIAESPPAAHPVSQDSQHCLLSPECLLGSEFLFYCAMAWELSQGCQLGQSRPTPPLHCLSDCWPHVMCPKTTVSYVSSVFVWLFPTGPESSFSYSILTKSESLKLKF